MPDNLGRSYRGRPAQTAVEVRHRTEVPSMPTKTRKRLARSRVAHGLLRYAVSRSGKQKHVADELNVSRARLSHWLTDEPDNPLTRLIVSVMDLAESDEATAREFSEAITRAVIASELWTASTETLLDRARYLRGRVNVLGYQEVDVGQQYFLGMASGEQYADAQRDEGHAQFELADIRDVLRAREGIELRDALAEGSVP